MLQTWYRWRARKGKEDFSRINERYGLASQKRPANKLIWIHAVSVGECMAMEPLIGMIKKHRPHYELLVTTGTVSAAEIVAKKYKTKVIHQYLPAPLNEYIRRFIGYWKPSLALFCESELWPPIFKCLKDSEIPAVIVNGRMSAKSARRWRKWPEQAKRMGMNITRCLVQNASQADKFSVTECSDIRITGNMKFDAAPPEVNNLTLNEIKKSLNGRPAWIAASTRPGEENFVIEAHKAIKAKIPNVCTIWVPRHPERRDFITAKLANEGINFNQRSLNSTADAEVFLGDSIGEMGLYYRLSDIVFLGGSLINSGGQNPIEPIKLGCTVISGEEVFNFQEIYEILWKNNAALKISDADGLAKNIINLLSDNEQTKNMNIKSNKLLTQFTGSLEKTWQSIQDLL